MHLNMSLFNEKGNVFFDENAEEQLSQEARYFLGGLIKHARNYTLTTSLNVWILSQACSASAYLKSTSC